VGGERAVKSAVAIVDGEHYPPVVRDALQNLPYDFLAVHLIGGTEKLRGGEDYGVPRAQDLDEALVELEPEVVVDLSDEPVLGPRERFRTASRVLFHGIPYVGADFRFDPPLFAPFSLPSLAIIGTGKRVGKTAVAEHAARVLSEDREVVIVAMGRGGPPEPEVAEAPPSLERLLELSRQGRHAASDYLEDAALAEVVTIGCRRCGGGLAGMPAFSNVVEGADLAAAREPDLVIFEGSGAAIPPVAVDRRVLVVDAGQDPEVAAGYLNAYRILISDLVVLTMAGNKERAARMREAIADVKPGIPIVAVELRPRPLAAVAGRRVALFSTALPAAHAVLAAHLRDAHGAATVEVFGSLADRARLSSDLDGTAAELYLVELKGAAIDVVAERAAERGIEVVIVGNDVVPLPGETDLRAELRALCERVPEPSLP